ncbi:MAG: 4-hydroxy-3-methylbut-2-enyl diphosphate reductase [Burkholderiaceae bacterium]|nr:4-hydroxy-3-methylbut-2-enyl diphosphate reductase [Burkholderiaceae bacterium]
MIEILLAQPRGFCAGVDRAIEIVERALERHGAPIYVRHEIVHNTHVVAQLRAKGAVFVEELEEVPIGATLVFSAHGVSRAVREAARRRGLNVFDATCPLVTKVHVEVAKMRAQGREIVMIGHAGHPEVEGTMGQADSGIFLVGTPEDVDQLQVRDPNRLAYVTQTTLSVDDAAQVVQALKRRFPAIAEPKKADICYATQNRQDAVKALAAQVDVVIVVGSRNSSNSNRLREVAERVGVPAYLVEDASGLDARWLAGGSRVGLTAGASAPEMLVRDVVERLREVGACEVRSLDGVIEEVVFPLPKGLGGTSGAESDAHYAVADGSS